jgi:hypothetical protein
MTRMTRCPKAKPVGAKKPAKPAGKRGVARKWGFYVMDEEHAGGNPFETQSEGTGIASQRVFVGKYVASLAHDPRVVFITGKHADLVLRKLRAERKIEDMNSLFLIDFDVTGNTVTRIAGQVPFQRGTISSALDEETLKQIDNILFARAAINFASLLGLHRRALAAGYPAENLRFKEKSFWTDGTSLKNAIQRNAKNLGVWSLAGKPREFQQVRKLNPALLRRAVKKYLFRQSGR